VDAAWEALIASPTARTNFVSQLKTLMQGNTGTTADDIKGFNFDWERPSSAAEWGNYTQLAREVRTAINPLGMEVSVCDYGSTDTNWDATTQFDAKVYDQLFIMGYHYTALQNDGFATGKRNLVQQGTAKAFSNDQLAIGFGTYGTGGPSGMTSVGLDDILATGATLAYDQGTFTGTINGTSGTWTIESRSRSARRRSSPSIATCPACSAGRCTSTPRRLPGCIAWHSITRW
jgi:GH18 family chitinase